MELGRKREKAIAQHCACRYLSKYQTRGNNGTESARTTPEIADSSSVEGPIEPPCIPEAHYRRIVLLAKTGSV